MYHSTAKKHLELVDTLFKAALFKVYPNETIPRSKKILGFDSPDKEASKNSAIAQQNKMIRDLKPFNKFQWSHLPPNQKRRYTVRKEYLTAEEVNKRLKENPEQLECPELSYFPNVAGWHFWIEETPSQEEFFSMQYQTEMSNSSAAKNQ
ncbi:MAG: hypothetical protein H6R05_1128 [Burkholderiaceae bacterium]|nr:hypothetical protein [Burkholderiaceae bacterium]